MDSTSHRPQRGQDHRTAAGGELDQIGAHNREQFDATDVVEDYVQMSGLTPTETAIFDGHIPSGARILDLGVGAGRTTPWLRARGASYVGIDYAPGMVDAARSLHPDADLRVGDAADLADFADDSFDVVVFSYNGIDYLDDEARGRALHEIARVLVPEGTYVFSTHNPRAIVVPPPATGAPLPKRLAISAVTTARRTVRMVRNRAFRTGEGWVLDPVRGGLNTHVATPDRVREELAGHGFRVLEVVNGDLPRSASTIRTPWWYYACRSDG